MKRAYYSNTIREFISESNSSILGKLTTNHSNKSLDELQVYAWQRQIKILKNQLTEFQGQIYFEFTIPRMGKRVDNILIIKNVAFIIEFKVGDGTFEKYAIEQVIDYTTDLKNFHQGSHKINLVPVLVSTNATSVLEYNSQIKDHKNVVKSNQNDLGKILNLYLKYDGDSINIKFWENSIYKPTPTIVEAAQALYKGHDVKEITRSDSGTINLSKTAECINSIINNSKIKKNKSICFVTGVPGAGKTLAGLNIAVERMNVEKDEHAVFLSGNGPLVDVLREALSRDEVLTHKENGEKLSKKEARIKANTFIQNIHHFRDDNLISEKAPVEKVVVFDEAQRAWTNHQVSKFMKTKKQIKDFNKSEPQFLIEVMDRHSDYCTIICLIGGGQEINTGEAGLEEWIISLKNYFPDWIIYYSNSILDSDNYLKSAESKKWLVENGNIEIELHLAVSVRSFRSEQLSNFVHQLLNIKIEESKRIYSEIKKSYPIVITRNLEKAKDWLRSKAKGSERTGLLISSGAKRIRSSGIDSENSLRSNSGHDKISNWFLNDKRDVRSSYFLETAATEFVVQGLEIDWACIAWGGNFYMNDSNWKYQNFKGSKWQNINKQIDKEYLKNTYRVLLTRARQGMVIFIAQGDGLDHTRPKEFYDNTFLYLKKLGIREL